MEAPVAVIDEPTEPEYRPYAELPEVVIAEPEPNVIRPEDSARTACAAPPPVVISNGPVPVMIPEFSAQSP
ncbi:hypothetical protein D3C87_1521090 [compost metagenome]